MAHAGFRRELNQYPQVAVVGSGHWGKNLVRNFYDLQALTVVCDNDRDKLRLIGEHYPGCRMVGCYADVLKDAAIQAVAIATPAETRRT